MAPTGLAFASLAAFVPLLVVAFVGTLNQAVPRICSIFMKKIGLLRFTIKR